MSSNSPRQLLITTALLYANGPLHLGHMLEHVQADIWVRFQRMRGHHCVFLSGNDAHGTPIMIRAEKEGTTPEELIAQIHEEHARDLADFHIEYDCFDTTHAPENQARVYSIYHALQKNGDITKRTIEQAYDPVKNLFLPDRYIKGTCPRCDTPDQYGDNCEACGVTYDPSELKNPISILSGVPPIQKTSEHYFFDLKRYEKFLREWANSGHLQNQVSNKLEEWFETGLQSWDISRDAPYFGFEIPNAPGKYFYVWLDAPIGYIACFEKLSATRSDLSFGVYWSQKSLVELYHFIGKDIVYFHALFWPALLKGAELRTPTGIFAHGFLTVNGQKMSKSRGTFITAREYLNQFNPEYLRYYFASKLTQQVEDVDFNPTDFTQKINSDLIGKFVNIASRCAGFISQHFGGELSDRLEWDLIQKAQSCSERIAQYYEAREYNHAIREIMALADQTNQYIAEKKPWAMVKDPEQFESVQIVCSTGLNLFRILVIYLKPVLVQTAAASELFLQIPPLVWSDIEQPLLSHTINPFQPLLQRIQQAPVFG